MQTLMTDPDSAYTAGSGLRALRNVTLKGSLNCCAGSCSETRKDTQLRDAF